MKAVSNSGPLMALSKLGQVSLLYDTYGIVLIPTAVYEEVVVAGLSRGEADAVLAEIEVRRTHLQVLRHEESDLAPEISVLPLDRGEKHAISRATWFCWMTGKHAKKRRGWVCVSKELWGFLLTRTGKDSCRNPT